MLKFGIILAALLSLCAAAAVGPLTTLEDNMQDGVELEKRFYVYRDAFIDYGREEDELKEGK
ncbi:hypothetical protein AC578_8336 [Pseudocercospora eumusae]|uniref:Uncharacterized protein n=1 Tax=Pseudocercospora eumusae TaxID=321146 RepID=A0A139GWC0_9PEZI|nr:hypothetical protein AC578_8336 [Pseudocercospora eumusae]